MPLMLLAVAAISGTMTTLEGEIPADALAILVIVLLNGLLGVVQERRATGALRALRQQGQPAVRVRREGRWLSLGGESLVPGDVIRLEPGARIPADARLLEGHGLGLDESALTGESTTATKETIWPLTADTPLHDRRTCVFQGTEVLRGSGTALVFATAMNTELGRIAGLIATAGGDPTPLQQRLADLARSLVLGALALVALVALAGWWSGLPPLDLLAVALSLAVAVVPEGLPAVITVALAIGTRRMASRGALIRSLPAVETLGSVTVICTDKTGTLTQNRQMVVELRTGTAAFGVDGGEGTAEAAFTRRMLTPPPGLEQGAAPGALELLLAGGVICSDADLEREEGGPWRLKGDSTEGALLLVAVHADPEALTLRRLHPRLEEVPFRSERPCMAVRVRDPDATLQRPLATAAAPSPTLWISKGAPETILADCDRWLGPRRVEPLTSPWRDWWLEESRALAAAGLRLLALACRPDGPGEREGWILLGLVAERDPARQEVAGALRRCHQAGIRPVMLTGDHPLTARAIGVVTGMVEEGAPVLLGEAIEAASDDELALLVQGCSLFARVTPEQKLRIVRALQRNGAVVAMSGDGTNDAPALKQAHIGIAMGLGGTTVSREAADIVLLDDDFTTIVAAVEEGRLVYANIRRFVRYVLGSNVGELLTVVAVPLLGWSAAAQTPLQILWINLLTDGLPALALALEPPEADLMRQAPIPPQQSILAGGVGRYVLGSGALLALLMVALMGAAAARGMPWQTMVFTSLCLAQMGHALSARSERPLLRLPPLANPWLLGAVSLGTGLQLALLTVPVLARFFGIVPLSWLELAICGGVSLLYVALLELAKACGGRGGSPLPVFQADATATPPSGAWTGSPD